MTLDGWICGFNPPLRSGLTNWFNPNEFFRSSNLTFFYADLIPVLVQGGAPSCSHCRWLIERVRTGETLSLGNPI